MQMSTPQEFEYQPRLPHAPRGRFDFSVLTEALDIIKFAPIPFMAFALIGFIILMAVNVIGSIPQNIIMFGGFNNSDMSAILVVTAIGAIINMILQQSAMTANLAGSMVMGRTAMRRELPDVAEGFSAYKKFFALAITGIIPTLAFIPFLVIAMSMIMSNTQMFRGNVSESQLFGFLGQFFGIYAIGFVLYIIIWTLFFLAPVAVLIEDLPPGQAIAKSFKISSKNFFPLFFYLIVYCLLSVAGVCACIVGYFFVQPWLAVTTMLIYRDIANVPIISYDDQASGYSPYPRGIGAPMPSVSEQARTQIPDDPNKPPQL